MATIDDLDINSISDMTTDEAIELLRQLRLSRRVSKVGVKKKSTAVKNKQKAMPALTPEQAAELLKLLGG